MALSRDQFAELLERFEASPDPLDARHSRRVAVRRHVAVMTDPADPSHEEARVVLQDVSRGGACITHHEGMPRGKRFVLLFPGSDDTRISVPCVVRNCQMVRQHLFRIGAEFESASPAELGAYAQSATPIDQGSRVV
jgi:hypothetical protein